MDTRVLEEYCEITRDKDNEQVILSVTVKHQPKPCEDCGDVVTNRIVHTRACQLPFKHWRKQCGTCRRFENPLNGKYEFETSHQVHNVLVKQRKA